MEARQKTTLAYAAIIAVLAVIAGALFFAYRGLSDEGERLAAANRTMSGERDALRSEAQAQRDRARAFEADLKSLQEKNAELADEKQALAKKIAETERQASAAAAARVDLSRELKATEQTMDEAKARSAKLNKAYESLLKDKSQLAAADAARQAELEKTRKAFEEAQAEIARLTGARGIYTVQNVDSLSTIAAFFYRNGNRWPDIYKANSFLIDGPDLIYPGQVLIVPK